MGSEIIRPSKELPDRFEDPPFYYTCLLLRFLQVIFGERQAGDFQWLDAEDQTEITITDELPIARERAEAMPVLVTQRAEISFSEMALDNLKDLDWHTGTKTLEDILPGLFFIHCLSRNKTEAGRLGWTVFTACKRWRGILQRSGMHQFGLGLRLSPPVPAGSLVSPEPSSEMRVVTVSAPFAFRWTEKEIPLDAPKAREIQVKIFGQALLETLSIRKNTVLYGTRGVPIEQEPLVPLDSEELSIEVRVKS